MSLAAFHGRLHDDNVLLQSVHRPAFINTALVTLPMAAASGLAWATNAVAHQVVERMEIFRVAFENGQHWLHARQRQRFLDNPLARAASR